MWGIVVEFLTVRHNGIERKAPNGFLRLTLEEILKEQFTLIISLIKSGVVLDSL